MTTKPLTLQRLPMIFATGLLSTGLLLSGCSNNDKVEADSANTASDTEETAAVDANNSAADAPMVDGAQNENAMATDGVSPMSKPDKQNANQQKSLVTNSTQSGTPEDTVKQALDSLYQGDVKKSAGYYKVDMANFEQELAKTQSAFEQTVDGVTITDTKYNDDKTRATITGELMLKGQSEPAPLTYELQKIEGQWKILG